MEDKAKEAAEFIAEIEAMEDTPTNIEDIVPVYIEPYMDELRATKENIYRVQQVMQEVANEFNVPTIAKLDSNLPEKQQERLSTKNDITIPENKDNGLEELKIDFKDKDVIELLESVRDGNPVSGNLMIKINEVYGIDFKYLKPFMHKPFTNRYAKRICEIITEKNKVNK